MAMRTRLTARVRETSGKSEARKLRREGRIPAVIYGHGEETRSLSVDAHELAILFSGISVENTLLTLDIEGQRGDIRALVREVQNHPYKPHVLHVDFYAVHADEELEVDVPLRLEGLAPGVKEGGHLEQIMHELAVRCLPDAIPQSIEVDVSGLEIGDSLHVSAIILPEGVRTEIDPERTICTLVAPSVITTEEEEEVEEPELLEGVDGAVEPELVGRREAEEDAGETAEED